MGCDGFVTSPTFQASSTVMPYPSALFSRKSRRAKKAMEQVKKEELKIVGLDQVGDTVKMQVTVDELRKIFHNVDDLLQGDEAKPAGSVTRPKVVSSSSLITQADVLAAHRAWGDGLVMIAKTYEEKGFEAAKKVAQTVLDSAYGYAVGIPVCFKPTLASGETTFRLTNEGALVLPFKGGERLSLALLESCFSVTLLCRPETCFVQIKMVRLPLLTKHGAIRKMMKVTCVLFYTTPHYRIRHRKIIFNVKMRLSFHLHRNPFTTVDFYMALVSLNG
jgi:hypothetical protein